MCDLCVMNAVKDKMLSRRNFFKSAGSVAIGAGLATTMSAPPSLAAGHGQITDMTHRLHPAFPTYFGEPGFAMETLASFADSGFNNNRLLIVEHTGTHIDAPLHFSADGTSVDEIPVGNLLAPLCVIDIAARAVDDADTQVTPDDLRAWMDTHGDIPDGACVAMHSGWGGKVDGDGFRNFDGTAQHYPGFHIEATQMLIEETGAASMAVDTLSLDHGVSADFATHYAWLPTGRFGIECLANLDQVPAAGATLVIGAPKHAGGSGGPARILAMV